MPQPEGNLSSAQFEILEVLWDADPSGATVSEIWESISQHRPVVRTTVLNLVDRLAKRGWLVRHRLPGGIHFRAAVSREEAERRVAREVVDGFFGGSASNLVMSLLGSEEISPDDVAILRRLLEEAARREKENPRD